MPSFFCLILSLINLYFLTYFITSFEVPSGELSSITKIWNFELYNLIILFKRITIFLFSLYVGIIINFSF